MECECSTYKGLGSVRDGDFVGGKIDGPDREIPGVLLQAPHVRLYFFLFAKHVRLYFIVRLHRIFWSNVLCQHILMWIVYLKSLFLIFF